MEKCGFPIDAVITWVDGNDKRHKAKRMEYGNDGIFQAEDVAGSTRYASVGEIFYCVASLNRYAPWIRRIYIVTDNQNPKLDGLIKANFPQGHIPMKIIDHKAIFRGCEEYLPTFNSISIETMTWRIPGLSEHYIELNDDFFLAAPVKPEDFFTAEGNVVCYGKKYSSLLVRITRIMKRHWNGRKKVTFKENMLNAASLLRQRVFFIKIYHTPRALLKSVYEKFFTSHPELLEMNISHRFRSHRQYTPQEAQYLLLLREKRCTLRNAYDNLLYLKPKKDIGYTERKLRLFDRHKDFKFCCINSLDQTGKETQKTIIEWLENRIGVTRKKKYSQTGPIVSKRRTSCPATPQSRLPLPSRPHQES